MKSSLKIAWKNTSPYTFIICWLWPSFHTVLNIANIHLPSAFSSISSFMMKLCTYITLSQQLQHYSLTLAYFSHFIEDSQIHVCPQHIAALLMKFTTSLHHGIISATPVSPATLVYFSFYLEYNHIHIYPACLSSFHKDWNKIAAVASRVIQRNESFFSHDIAIYGIIVCLLNCMSSYDFIFVTCVVYFDFFKSKQISNLGPCFLFSGKKEKK